MSKKTSVPSVPNEETSVPSVPNEETSFPSVPNEISRYLSPNDKVRSMLILCYVPPERFTRLLEEAYKYAYILHDKDVNEDGTPKQAHYHILVRFRNPRFRSSVEKLIDFSGLKSDTTVMFERVDSFHSTVAYLIHATKKARDDCKFVYSRDSLITNDNSYFNSLLNRYCSLSSCSFYDTNSEFIDDLVSDDFSYRSMAEKYGRDFIKNHNAYMSFAEKVRKEDYQAKREMNLKELLDNGVKDCSEIVLIARYIVDNMVDFSNMSTYMDYASLNTILKTIKAEAEKIIGGYHK